MRTNLDVVQHNIADWTRVVEVAMNARVAAIAAADAELDAKIHSAKAKLIVPRNTYLREQKFFKRKIWPFKENREKFKQVTLEFERAQEVVVKLEKAKVLIASLQRDDLIRQSDITVQNTKITPLWEALDAKTTRGEAWDDADKSNYKKIQKAQDFIAEIHAQILKNTLRIGYCHRLAAAYDDAHPEQFPGHWLNIASVIVEQQDRYGFKGEIDRRDMSTTKTPGSGLEGYSTSYGAVLKPTEVVRYTLPGTKIQLEQDRYGKIVDKTPAGVDMQHKALAAIKMAHLLFLDRVRHPDKPICLNGGAESLQQARLIVAALQVQAKQAGLVFNSSDLIVDIPGWRNWRGSDVETNAQIAQYETEIEGIIVRHHAQDDLKEKVGAVRGKTLIDNEPSHPPRKH